MERSASLTLIHEVLLDGGDTANVGHRRRNGLGNIFQGVPLEDLSKLQTISNRLNGRSSSCPCSPAVARDNKKVGSDTKRCNISKPTFSKRKFHLLHNKRWTQRRMALGDIFTEISKDKVKELLRSKQRQRRLALADIFAGIPQDKVSELISENTGISGCQMTKLKIHGEESCHRNGKEHNRRRRFALGDIFVNIPSEEVKKLISDETKSSDDSVREADTTKNHESAIEKDVKQSKVVDWDIENDSGFDDGPDQVFDDNLQNQLYMKTFFSSLIKQQHKQRCGYMMRTMSMPCYSQFDMEQKLPSNRRRNGQWDVLSDLSCQEHDSLKGQYVSNVIFAS